MAAPSIEKLEARAADAEKRLTALEGQQAKGACCRLSCLVSRDAAPPSASQTPYAWPQNASFIDHNTPACTP